MTLKLNGSSSGSVSIDAPASTTGGAAVTLTLPVDDGDANQVLETNGSGALSWVSRNTPNFSAHGTQSLSASSWYDLVCGTEKFDSSSAYNTSTGEFTVPSGQGGKYFFEAMVQIPNFNSGNMVSIGLDLGGSFIDGAVVHTYSSGTGYTLNPQVAAFLDLSAGNVVKVKYWHNSAGGTQTSTRQYFFGWRVV
tara:strand:+ start:25 stop:603 length:579 start_codon:yes stop_codon:yes gene_type:complete